MLSYFLGIVTQEKIYKAYHTIAKFVLVFSYLVLNKLTILIRFRTMVNRALSLSDARILCVA